MNSKTRKEKEKEKEKEEKEGEGKGRGMKKGRERKVINIFLLNEAKEENLRKVESNYILIINLLL